MSLDLVARARSMDGSADLKWRNADHSLAYHIGGPRSGAEGRSLDWSTSKGRGKKRQRSVLSVCEYYIHCVTSLKVVNNFK